MIAFLIIPAFLALGIAAYFLTTLLNEDRGLGNVQDSRVQVMIMCSIALFVLTYLICGLSRYTYDGTTLKVYKWWSKSELERYPITDLLRLEFTRQGRTARLQFADRRHLDIDLSFQGAVYLVHRLFAQSVE